MRRRAAAVLVALLAASCSGGSSSSSSSAPEPESSGAPTSVFVPSNPAKASGDVVSAEAYPELFGASSIDAQRITYLSRGVVVSGVVLAPRGDPPPGGWPIIAWDHGTTGLADRCAPSRSDNLGGVALGLVPLVQTGYVVAATDYPGLGTPGPHPYLDGASEGDATIDIVRAAREVVPTTSTKWFAVGHSQGGHAALFAGELAAADGAGLDLVGVVAVAPASQLPLFPRAVGTRTQTFLAMVISGVVATDPSVKLSDLLSPEAMAKADVFETGCNEEVGRAFATLEPLLAPGAATNPALVGYLARNDPGHHPTPAPVLLVQGDADTTVLPALTTALHASMCGQGDTVALRTYPGAGHTDVLLQALTDIRTFLADRLAGKPATSTC